jgi:hypothetical protein
MLIFFDDILVYNHSWAVHLHHLQLVLDTLHQNQLFMKRSKCAFQCGEVAYLGHVISAAKVAMDQQKVQAILDWLLPSSVCAVRSFLGLAGNYRHFICDFHAITMLLTKFPLVPGGGTCLPHPLVHLPRPWSCSCMTSTNSS